MTDRIWDKFLTARDKAVFAAAGYAQAQGYGQRPAVLIIDVNYNFCGDKPEPILESVKRWPSSCGEDAWTALPHIKSLVDVARKRGLPVIYTTGGFRDDGWDFGSWRWKVARMDEMGKQPQRNIDGDEIMPQIKPAPQDIVIEKQ